MKAHPLFRVDEHVAGFSWSADGGMLGILPVAGPVIIASPGGGKVAELPDHGLGNGTVAWHPFEPVLATCGYDGRVRLYDAGSWSLLWEQRPGKGWLERVRWSPDGTRLAAAVGKRLLIFDEEGQVVQEFDGHKSTVCDMAWNPRVPEEIASVCDGGAHLWRVGEEEPFARFDWGGASLIVTWSPDGRWVVTGDQTPSVHLYDVTRDHPLHIQGYETKVKTLAFTSHARKLATGGGRLVTIWTCTGKTGPEGSMPEQLEAHDDDVAALAYRPKSDWLISGGADGLLCLFETGKSGRAKVLRRFDSGVTTVAWSPNGALAVGTEGGEAVLFEFNEKVA